MKTSFLVSIILLLSANSVWGQGTSNTDPNVASNRIPMKKLVVEQLPNLNIARGSHSIFYANGELTVVGGHTAGFVPTATAEYYSDGAWHLINSVYTHDNGMVVVLDGGKRVLLAGGHEKNLGIGQTYEAEMYYPETHTFDGFSCLDRKRAFSQGVELDNGEVIIAGNHMGNDAFELFDGKKTFRHFKEVSAWRSSPYILPISGGDAIVFGSLWENANCCNVPYDTVDRMNGNPFRVPLLGDLIPILYDENNHANESFIGDKKAGDYSYVIAASKDSGEIVFIHIKDTVFTLIPTTHPIPKTIGYAPIDNWSPAIADRKAHKTYMVGHDSTGRVYVAVVEYDKRPAPLTLFYSDPMQDFSYCTPVLTPDGDLAIVGGITYSNFTPFSTVWLLHVGEKDETFACEAPESNAEVWWVLLGLLIAAAIIIVVWKKCCRQYTPVENHTTTDKVQNCNNTETKRTENITETENNDGDLMERIRQLMETDQLYLKPDLQVANIADALGIHRNAVSACINSQQGCTFSQYINQYRVSHAKRLLRESPDMKISAVGLDSGFANERSFFRAFKMATGKTPREWMNES